MKPALLIDFDGTLCRDRFWQSLPPTDYKKINDFLFAGNNLVYRWMQGLYSSENICSILADELSIDREILWKGLVADCRSMNVCADVLPMIEFLKNKYTVALVTVNMDCFDRFAVPALGLDKYFDHIINSFNEKVFKHGPDRGLFDIALARCGAQYQNSVLIDDSQNACDEFQGRGGRSLKISESNCLNYWLGMLIKEISININ